MSELTGELILVAVVFFCCLVNLFFEAAHRQKTNAELVALLQVEEKQ